jgi:hypothetical protein
MPRALITVDRAATGLAVSDVVKALRDGDPSIAVSGGRAGIYLNPQTLQEGEETIVIRRLAQVLGIG